MTKTRFFILLCLSFMLVVPFTVLAFEVKTDDVVYIDQDETVEGNLYAAGANITVDGTVTGDVFCGGQTVNINGRVEGDVICAGQSVNINGEVGGSVRAAGNTVNINGTVARGVQAFGASVILGKGASVGWDMLMAGATGEIRGKIGRGLHGAAANVVIGGEIGQDVRLKLDEKIQAEKRGIGFEKKEKSPLTITDEAVINGSLIYSSSREGLIAEGASIAGEVKHNLPKIKPAKKKMALGYAWGKLYSIFAALVVGLVLISLWGKEIKKLTDKMLNKVGASIGWGIVVMFITPILAILLLITLIGIPLAFIMMAVWLIALYISKILVGILIGRSILEKLWKKQKESLIWAMIIGIVATWIVFSIPVIGWLLCLVAVWWGLGGIWLYCKKA